MNPSHADWRTRLRDGVRSSAGVAFLVAFVVALVNMVPTRRHPRPLPPISVFVAVWCGLFVGGIIVALGRPLVRDRYGAALLGAATVAPSIIVLAMALGGAGSFTVSGLLLVGAICMLIGTVVGVVRWRPEK